MIFIDHPHFLQNDTTCWFPETHLSHINYFFRLNHKKPNFCSYKKKVSALTHKIHKIHKKQHFFFAVVHPNKHWILLYTITCDENSRSILLNADVSTKKTPLKIEHAFNLVQIFLFCVWIIIFFFFVCWEKPFHKI